jgi:uncharacterized membrane protein
MKRSTRKTLTVVVAVTACLFCCTASEAKKPPKPPGGGPPAYTIIPFSPPGVASTASMVHDFNDLGCAVGDAVVGGSTLPLHLDVETGDYTVMQGTAAIGVNNLNQIVGENGDFQAAFWASPESQPVALPPLPGGLLSRATAINDAGVVVGFSEDGSAAPGWTSIGVVWRVAVDSDGDVSVAGPLRLEPLAGGFMSTAGDLNEVVGNAAQVIGWSDDGFLEAVVWTVTLNGDGTLDASGVPQGLGAPSTGYAINNFGDGCGQLALFPFVAPSGNAALPLPVPENATGGYAWDLNDSNLVVGNLAIKPRRKSTLGIDRAFLWQGGEIIDLATQIGNDSGWRRLHKANQISNDGIIAGQGEFDVSNRGFLMIPISP